MTKDLRFLIQKPIAHRGLHDDKVVENSLLAFSRAMDAGHSIELDVQMTLDKKLVVFHDWDLGRLTGKDGKLSEKTYNEIKDLHLNNTRQKILLLEDVLMLINGNVPLVIEIKSQKYFDNSICKEIYKVIENYNGKFAISSFNPFVVRWFAKEQRGIVRGQNFTDFKNNNKIIAYIKKMFSYFLWILSNNNPDFYAVRTSMLPRSFPVRSAIRHKKIIFAYTIKNKEDYDRIKDIVDNGFFDNID
jgi:glycerophosphoryl diester phosphodiesterase